MPDVGWMEEVSSNVLVETTFLPPHQRTFESYGVLRTYASIVTQLVTIVKILSRPPKSDHGKKKTRPSRTGRSAKA